MSADVAVLDAIIRIKKIIATHHHAPRVTWLRPRHRSRGARSDRPRDHSGGATGESEMALEGRIRFFGASRVPAAPIGFRLRAAR